MTSYDLVKRNAERAERRFSIAVAVFVAIVLAGCIALTAVLSRGAA